MKKIVLWTLGSVVGLFAVFMMIGVIALATGNGTENASAPTKTATATVTVTATPEPVTVTETADPVVKTREVTPQACIDALNNAESIVHKVPDLTSISSQYIGLIPKAYTSGVQGGVGAQRVIDQMHSLTEQTQALNREIRPLIAQYNVKALGCRSMAH